MEFYNQDNNIDNNNENQERQEHNRPEYSFWAENMSNSSTGYDYYRQIPIYEEKPKKKKGVKKFFAFLAKALVFGILAGATFIGVQFLYYKLNPDAFRNSENYFLGSHESSGKKLKVSSTDTGSVSSVPDSTIMKVAEEAMPSIVSITSVSTSTYWFGVEIPSEGSGSGIIVGKDDNELLIATNNHVVDGASKITVTVIDDTQAEAVIKGTDATADLAVISVDISALEKNTLDAIKIAKLGNSDDAKVGEMVIAIGNALGYGQSVTVGYISAKDRKVEISDNYSYKTMVLLQTDAAINPGNSGGALLNIKGEVIGINTVKFADYKVEGMGFAIPISRATPIINELMSREILAEDEQGFLGVMTIDVTEDVSERFKIPVGVYVNSVVKDSPADKAGLKEGDVIKYVNDVEVTSASQLKELISSIRAGTEVEIKFMRHIGGDYKEQTVKATLGSKSEANN